METDRKIYALFQFVLNDEAYAPLAASFRDTLGELQVGAQTFSAEQWSLISNYLEAFSAVFQTMLKIVLESAPNTDAAAQ